MSLKYNVRENYKKRWILFKNKKFPSSSIIPEVEDLRAKLIEYDGFLAGQIETYLKNVNKTKKLLIVNDHLMKNLHKLNEKYKTLDPVIITLYDYFVELQEIVSLINQEITYNEK